MCHNCGECKGQTRVSARVVDTLENESGRASAHRRINPRRALSEACRRLGRDLEGMWAHCTTFPGHYARTASPLCPSREFADYSPFHPHGGRSGRDPTATHEANSRVRFATQHTSMDSHMWQRV